MRFSSLFIGAAVLTMSATALAQPTVVVHDDDDYQPVAEERTVWGPSPLFYSGMFSFGLSYTASVIVAATTDGSERLYVPVAGPWLELGQGTGCSRSDQSCSNREITSTVLLVGDGILQAGGALAIIFGALMPAETTVETTRTAGSLHIAPVSLGRGAPGLLAFGSF